MVRMDNLWAILAEKPSLGEAAVDLVVVIGGEFQPPAIKPEVKEEEMTFFRDSDRPEITAPGIVGRQVKQSHLLRIATGGDDGRQNQLACRRDNHHPLMVADGSGNGGKDRFDLVKVVTPVAVGMGPAEEDTILFFPFGREAAVCHEV